MLTKMAEKHCITIKNYQFDVNNEIKQSQRAEVDSGTSTHNSGDFGRGNKENGS